jgi:hypothetical protein
LAEHENIFCLRHDDSGSENIIAIGGFMKLKYLRYFPGVAEEPSFARAAARVRIERSPLFSVLHELESDWETRLRFTWPSRNSADSWLVAGKRNPFLRDMKIQGYAGRREGVTGSLRVRYFF